MSLEAPSDEVMPVQCGKQKKVKVNERLTSLLPSQVWWLTSTEYLKTRDIVGDHQFLQNPITKGHQTSDGCYGASTSKNTPTHLQNSCKTSKFLDKDGPSIHL